MWETPPRSPTMVGIAVETMVWSRLDMSMPASRAEKIRLIRRRVSTIGGAAGWGGGACAGLLGADVGAAGARQARERTTPAARGWGRGSVGRSGQSCDQHVPRLVDEAGERRGEAGREPEMHRGAHGRGSRRRQQHGV